MSSRKEGVEEKTKGFLDIPKQNFPSNIVCLATAEWEGTHFSYHHATEEFARRGFRVVYVSPPVDLARSLKALFKKRTAKPLMKWLKRINIFKKPKKLEKNFLIAPGLPLLLGFGFWGIVDYLNRKLVFWSLKRLVQKLNMDEYILYTDMCPLTKIKDELCKLLVYECGDDFSILTSIPKRRLRLKDLERRMLKQVDLFFVTSRSLFSEKSKISPHGFYLPLSIDFNRFNRHRENRDLEKSLQGLGGPLIGLLSGMSNLKIDWDTLYYAAFHRPDYKFILAGRVDGKAPEALANLKNVFFLGPQEEEDISTLLQGFDVGLIPFNRNFFGDHAFPTKMPEYLFFGMSVVSTDIPNLREYEDIIEIARDKEEFAKKIDKCLTENHDKRSWEKRKRVAKRFSKEQRAEEILEKMKNIWELKFPDTQNKIGVSKP
ncbi:MAG: glycosyltransferase [candidate division Zixibacteria bacterium]|nr:glycosyltransferase [candidate division Zixibacteria bacterium]